MIGFYSEEEDAFRASVASFVEREVEPISERIERENDIPKEIYAKMGAEGITGVLHPREYGGTQRGVVYETIVAEEISAVCPALDMSRMASCTLYGMPLNKFGTNEQKKKYLLPIAQGKKLGALGITEPNVGSDTAGMQTTAVKNGDGWVLDGEKRYITNGSNADYIVLFAITDKSVHAKKGMTAFVIETSWKGFEVVKDYELLGMRGVRNTHFALRGMRVPDESVLGGVGKGFTVLMDELNSERAAIAGECVGYARGAFEEAVPYSKERVQFDRPIADFEGVSFKIADMATDIEAARLLTLYAARLCDAGKDATKHASMAKVFAAETAFQVCDQALQVMGGTGYTKERKVEKFFRDARLMRIGGGTSEILKFLIQREVYKEAGFR